MLQWNLYGLHSHFERLYALLSDIFPVIPFFQESRFNTIESVVLKNILLYDTDYPAYGCAYDGVAFCVVDTLYSTPVHSTTNLQASRLP